MDNDGTAVPITSAQDAQSSGDEEDEDEDMEGDEGGRGAMQCQDIPGDGAHQQVAVLSLIHISEPTRPY